MTEPLSESIAFDGVHRHHTEIKVIVHSHLDALPLNISQDVISCNTHKGVKSVGKANLTLTGSTNYLSRLFPDDYINIYFNTGDGRGWVRNFFGFIDRIQESFKVSDSGVPTTIYTLSCTDFQKAVERTQIYNNPYILGRRDTIGRAFGVPNIGGVALMGNGIRAHGSPADIVLNFLYVYMGFASQFLLPESYSPRFMERYRQQRTEYLLSSVAPQLRQAIDAEGGFESFMRNIEEQVLDSLIVTDDGTGDLATPDALQAQVEARVRATLQERTQGNLTQFGQVMSAYRTNAVDAPPSLLDIVDTTTFVERGAIDGYSFSETLWMQQGSLWNVLVSMSNEMVNEMFFDLRPMTEDRDLTNTKTYALAPDEIAGNVDENTGTVGPQYLPALVMREYPFSTIHDIDARSAPTGLDNRTFGILHFGAIFSHEPNRPGRHVVEMPNLNLEDLRKGAHNTPAFKHLDVTVIDQTDIMESDFGRSDHDHFNLLESLSSDVIGEQAAFFMCAELPVITPIHIIQHGLRTRRLDTRFARFSERTFHVHRSGATPESRTTTSPREEEETTPTIRSQPDARDVPRRVRNNPNWRRLERLAQAYEPYGCQGVNDLVLAATMHSEFGAGNGVFTDHTYAVGWSAKNIAQTGFNGGGGRRNTGNRRGGRSPYRNGTGSTTNIAEAIMPNFVPGRNRGSSAEGQRANRPQVTARFPGFLTLTDDTGQAVYDPAQMNPLLESGEIDAHLERYFRSNETMRSLVAQYFETARGILDGSIPDPAASRGGGGSITFFHSRHASVLDDPAWAETPEGRRSRLDRYQRRFSAYYVIPADSSTSNPSTYSHIFGQLEITQTPTEESSQPASEGSSQQRASTTGGAVDSAMSRQQLLRWALLHDHWFQHNLEYLSGSIMMRGDPTVRPGFRLDIRDRNLSFYVETVGQQFQYPNKLTTTLEVSRGQPNNPFPVYVMPNSDGFNPTQTQRQVGSRLEQYFHVQDTASTLRSLVFRDNEYVTRTVEEEVNYIDSPEATYDENLIQADYVENSAARFLDPNWDPTEVLDQFAEESLTGLDAAEAADVRAGIDGAVRDAGRSTSDLEADAERGTSGT